MRPLRNLENCSYILRGFEPTFIKKTVHIKRPEQTCCVHCLNMYSDDGPGLIILSFGSRNRITESYYFIYTCTRFTIKNVSYFTLLTKYSGILTPGNMPESRKRTTFVKISSYFVKIRCGRMR
jgi:hypothetical protein